MSKKHSSLNNCLISIDKKRAATLFWNASLKSFQIRSAFMPKILLKKKLNKKKLFHQKLAPIKTFFLSGGFKGAQKVFRSWKITEAKLYVENAIYFCLAR